MISDMLRHEYRTCDDIGDLVSPEPSRGQARDSCRNKELCHQISVVHFRCRCDEVTVLSVLNFNFLN